MLSVSNMDINDKTEVETDHNRDGMFRKDCQSEETE